MHLHKMLISLECLHRKTRPFRWNFAEMRKREAGHLSIRLEAQPCAPHPSSCAAVAHGVTLTVSPSVTLKASPSWSGTVWPSWSQRHTRTVTWSRLECHAVVFVAIVVALYPSANSRAACRSAALLREQGVSLFCATLETPCSQICSFLRPVK